MQRTNVVQIPKMEGEMVHTWADPAPPLEGGGWGTAAGLAQGEKVTHSILKNKGGNGAQNVRAPFFPAHFFPWTPPGKLLKRLPFASILVPHSQKPNKPVKSAGNRPPTFCHHPEALWRLPSPAQPSPAFPVRSILATLFNCSVSLILAKWQPELLALQ